MLIATLMTNMYFALRFKSSNLYTTKFLLLLINQGHLISGEYVFQGKQVKFFEKQIAVKKFRVPSISSLLGSDQWNKKLYKD